MIKRKHDIVFGCKFERIEHFNRSVLDQSDSLFQRPLACKNNSIGQLVK